MILYMLENGTFVLFSKNKPVFACKYINTMLKFLAKQTGLDFTKPFQAALNDMALNDHNCAEFGFFGQYLFSTNKPLKEFV